MLGVRPRRGVILRIAQREDIAAAGQCKCKENRQFYRHVEVNVQLAFRATFAVLLLLIYSRPALSEVPEGSWLLANRVAVQVFECSGLVLRQNRMAFETADFNGAARCRQAQPRSGITPTAFVRFNDHLGAAARRSESLVRRLALRPARRQNL